MGHLCTVCFALIGKVHLDLRSPLRLQGLRQGRPSAALHQRLVLDGRATEAGAHHPEGPERLVGERRHRQAPAGQPGGPTGGRLRKLPRHPQPVLQRWRALARRRLPPRQTLGL